MSKFRWDPTQGHMQDSTFSLHLANTFMQRSLFLHLDTICCCYNDNIYHVQEQSVVYHTCTWHSLPSNCCSVQFVSSWLQQSPRQNHWALILMRACKLSMAC